VPPLPPHITFEQAKKFMHSLLRDPSRTAMLKQSMKEMLDAIKP
jgi:pyruvate dehydrogenase (quinone)